MAAWPHFASPSATRQPRIAPAAAAAGRRRPATCRRARPPSRRTGPSTSTRRSIPEGATYYIIVSAATRSGTSRARFLGNPYLWPQIWDQNRYITDAHWIYPGDPLIMPEVALVTDRAGEAGADRRTEPAEEGMPRPRAATAGGDAPLSPPSRRRRCSARHYVVADREDESLHRDRLRARRDQDRLRRPRHPVPEQGQQRRASRRATSTRSTTSPTR